MLRRVVFSSFIAWSCCLLASAVAQEINAPQLDADQDVLELSPDERRRLFLERVGRLGEHYREVPVAKSDAPFATEITNRPRTIRPPVREASFGQGAFVIDQQSITEKVGIQYLHASPTSEPTVAVRGMEILVTGNWYAAFSTDGGRSFKQLDPKSRFETNPKPAVGGDFCCDQIASYDAATDTMYWFLQGISNATGNNVRLKFATGADDIRNLRLRNLDLPSTLYDTAGAYWFDYPDIAFTNRYVYISLNVFDRPDNTKLSRWKAAVVMRLQKDQLARYERPSFAKFIETERGSLRFVQGASDTMFWAAHESNPGNIANFRVRYWRDDQAAPSNDVQVAVENWGNPRSSKPASWNAKNGRPWLKGIDGRMTAGWLANDILGFGWTADADNRFRNMHTRIALVRAQDVLSAASGATVQPVAEPHIWSNSLAIVKPAAAPNSLGDVAIAMAYGGSNNFPGYAVGFLIPTPRQDRSTPTDWEWGQFTIVAEGNNTQNCRTENGELICARWGDYFTVRSHGTDPTTWVTVGYVLTNSDPNEEIRAEATYAWFGLQGRRIDSSAPGDGPATADAVRRSGARRN